MAQFIEVHRADTNEPMLLNVSEITTVRDNGDGQAWLWMKDGGADGFFVAESYLAVKEQLGLPLP